MGHWAAAIIYRKLIKDKTIILFIDSWPAGRIENYNEMKRVFTVGISYKNMEFHLVESPAQYPLSNNCALFMLGAFMH